MSRTIPQATVVGALAVLLLVVGVAAGAGDVPARRDAELLLSKLDFINRNALAEKPTASKTPVTEIEVNAYLQFVAKDQLPTGVIDPVVGIVGDGRLTGRALVDLDEVKKHRQSGGLFDPMNFLGGQVPVAATGVLRTRDGVGQFQLESAHVSGIPVPKSLLQELVGYYSRSKDLPEGVNIDSPFQLPAKIREIAVEKGQAIIVQ